MSVGRNEADGREGFLPGGHALADRTGWFPTIVCNVRESPQYLRCANDIYFP